VDNKETKVVEVEQYIISIFIHQYPLRNMSDAAAPTAGATLIGKSSTLLFNFDSRPVLGVKEAFYYVVVS
jgi:hypothetical protein